MSAASLPAARRAAPCRLRIQPPPRPPPHPARWAGCCPSCGPTAPASLLAGRVPAAGGGGHAGLSGGAAQSDRRWGRWRPHPEAAPERGAQVHGAARPLCGAVFVWPWRWACFRRCRFYLVSWLGERITADLRNAVYDRMCCSQKPGVFRDHPDRARCCQPPDGTDTTLVQTVVGSSLSPWACATPSWASARWACWCGATRAVMVQVLLVVVPGGAAGHCGSAAGCGKPVARQPGPRGRLQRHRGRGAQRRSPWCKATRAEGARKPPLCRRQRTRLHARPCAAAAPARR
jgi:hypothetical protein